MVIDKTPILIQDQIFITFESIYIVEIELNQMVFDTTHGPVSFEIKDYKSHGFQTNTYGSISFVIKD